MAIKGNEWQGGKIAEQETNNKNKSTEKMQRYTEEKV